MGTKPDFDVAVERETLVEWTQLVHGGQFMDRILPAPIHDTLTSDRYCSTTIL